MVDVTGNQAQFCFFRPAAGRVCLVGDFNQWRDGQIPMTRGRDGYWRASVKLPPGTFRFRYRADEAWYTDYAACGLEPGPFGLDSLVVVDEA